MWKVTSLIVTPDGDEASVSNLKCQKHQIRVKGGEDELVEEEKDLFWTSLRTFLE